LPPCSTLFPYTTLFRSLNVFATAAFLSLVVGLDRRRAPRLSLVGLAGALAAMSALSKQVGAVMIPGLAVWVVAAAVSTHTASPRSEEHTSELQSRGQLL